MNTNNIHNISFDEMIKDIDKEIITHYQFFEKYDEIRIVRKVFLLTFFPKI